MSRTRIIHVIPTLDQSGAEKQLALLVTGLPKDRFDVHVLALTRGGFYERELKSAGISVEVIGKRFKGDPWALHRLTVRLRALAPHIVQTWLFAGNTYGRLAARWAKVPHIIASERCVDSWKSQTQLFLDRRLAAWTDLFVVNSQGVKSFYVRQKITPEKIEVIPNAVPRLASVDRTAARAELGVSDQDFVIGFIGRLWPQKRVEDVIVAADFLRLGEWPIQLRIIGDGPRRDYYDRALRSMDMTAYARMMGHRSDAQSLLAGFDALVLPSSFEGMPNVVLESMQAGVPVVATNIPGTNELISHDETGLLVPVRSPASIATALQRLLSEPDLRNRIIENAQKVVQERFSVARMVESYAKLYDRMIQ